MQIIEGFDLYHKLDTLAKEIANTSTPTVIITEHPEYVEDIFLHHTDVLFNIEIKSLINYERDLLVRKHIFNTKIYNTPTSDTSYSQIHFSFSSSQPIHII